MKHTNTPRPATVTTTRREWPMIVANPSQADADDALLLDTLETLLPVQTAVEETLRATPALFGPGAVLGTWLDMGERDGLLGEDEVLRLFAKYNPTPELH